MLVFARMDNHDVMYEKSELFSITEGNVGLGGLAFRKNVALVRRTSAKANFA